jgi:hypothetical protein
VVKLQITEARGRGSSPLGVPADLKSADKKGSTTYQEFAIPNPSMNEDLAFLQKMGPGCEIWSHFADFGPIFILKAEMLKPIN